MKHIKVYEEIFVKMKDVTEFTGTKPFKIDKDDGKLYKTTESIGEFYLTYDEYLKLEGLNDSIAKKCKLLDNQKQTTVKILQTAIRKIIHDRTLNNNIKKI
jgi:hypothetical protein